MKKGPFKMKGYSYPGASPVKGRRRREQLAKNRARTEEMMDEAFDSEIERSTDLMKSEGFKINPEVIPDEDVLAKSGPPKRSPARQDATSSIDWDEITKTATDAAIEAGIEGGVALGVEALKPKQRKGHHGPDVSGFSKLKFGRS